MKLGDSKQAITLGIVAVVAIGFLAKTAFATFGGQAARPIVVQELRGGPAPAGQPKPDDDQDPAKAGSNASANTKNTAPPPATTPVVDDTAIHARNAFAKISAADKDQKASAMSNSLPSGVPRETMTPTRQTGEGSMPSNPFGPGFDTSTQSLPDAKTTGSEIKEEVKKEPTTIRFDGFVDAGSPTAIVTYKGASFSVKVGDVLDDGMNVQTIGRDKLTLMIGKKLKTILLGREVEL